MVNCQRFDHMLRTFLKELEEGAMVFRCLLGKSTFRGARRPYTIAVPNYLLPGLHCFDTLPALYKRRFGCH